MTETPLFDRAFGALLFDMDGTIINSDRGGPSASGNRLVAERHGLGCSDLPADHSRRARDRNDIKAVLKLPGVDPAC